MPRNVSAQPLAAGPAPRLSPPLVAPPSPAPAPAPAFVQQPPRASSPYSAPPSVSTAPPLEDPTDLQTTKKRNNKPATGARPVQDSLPQLQSRRRIGLILLVLIVDLGLAIAGAAMLAEGLSTDDPPPRTSSDTAAPKPAAALPAAATAPAPAPPAPTPPPVTQPVAAPGSSSLTNAITDLPPPPVEPEKPRHSRKKKSTGKPGSGSAPVDPYEGSDPPPPPPPPPPAPPP